MKHLCLISIILIATLLSCNKIESQKTVAGAIYHEPISATIDVSNIWKFVYHFPGNALATRKFEPGEYGKRLDWAMSNKTEFNKALASGDCILIPHGTNVEVVAFKNDYWIWRQIAYEGKTWWLNGACLKSEDGEKMENDYEVDSSLFTESSP